MFGDERKEFRCNTIEFGCENVCFNVSQEPFGSFFVFMSERAHLAVNSKFYESQYQLIGSGAFKLSLLRFHWWFIQ